MRRKCFFPFLLALALIAGNCSSALAIQDNTKGSTVQEVPSGDTMSVNSGTIVTNNGTVATNVFRLSSMRMRRPAL